MQSHTKQRSVSRSRTYREQFQFCSRTLPRWTTNDSLYQRSCSEPASRFAILQSRPRVSLLPDRVADDIAESTSQMPPDITPTTSQHHQDKHTLTHTRIRKLRVRYGDPVYYGLHRCVLVCQVLMTVVFYERTLLFLKGGKNDVM